MKKICNETVYCRACLSEYHISKTKHLHEKWQQPLNEDSTGDFTLAAELCEMTKTRIENGDNFSEYICTTCFGSFQKAYAFVNRVRKSDKIMRMNQKYFKNVSLKRKLSADPSWLEPIKIETASVTKTQFDSMKRVPNATSGLSAGNEEDHTKNINKSPGEQEGMGLFVDKIKQEVVSEDDTDVREDEQMDNVCYNHVQVKEEADIKIEPEEITHSHGTLNGLLQERQFKSEELGQQTELGLGADTSTYDKNDLIDNRMDAPMPESEILATHVKHEPMDVEQEDLEANSDLSLDCMLCNKPFKTLSGLKAHVISWHAYKSISRNQISQQKSPTVKVEKKITKKKSVKYKTKMASKYLEVMTCKVCLKEFSNLQKLRTHEVSHKRRKCPHCGVHCASTNMLLLHVAECRRKISEATALNVPGPKPKTVQELRRVSVVENDLSKPNVDNEDKKVIICSKCDEKFEENIYLKIHNEIHHTPIENESEQENDAQSNVNESSTNVDSLETGPSSQPIASQNEEVKINPGDDLLKRHVTTVSEINDVALAKFDIHLQPNLITNTVPLQENEEIDKSVTDKNDKLNETAKVNLKDDCSHIQPISFNSDSLESVESHETILENEITRKPDIDTIENENTSESILTNNDKELQISTGESNKHRTETTFSLLNDKEDNKQTFAGPEILNTCTDPNETISSAEINESQVSIEDTRELCNEMSRENANLAEVKETDELQANSEHEANVIRFKNSEDT